MLTYQDYEAAKGAGGLADFIAKVIGEHIQSDVYQVALAADEYDAQRDVTVNNYTRFIAEHSGSGLVNVTAANNRISSNFFHRLNTQRCTYSLGNGVDFKDKSVKKRLGARFDGDFYRLAYNALKHRECFGFWNFDRLHVFPVTEFAPLRDENTGALRAGVRFWRIAPDKPLNAVFYDETGYTKFRSRRGGRDLEVVAPHRTYKVTGIRTKAEGFEAMGYENYSTLPIICMWGSDLHQSTLIGMRERIDSYDLIQSGFANDLQDCAQIYWIVENCGGMNEDDLRAFLNRMQRDHIVTADTKSMGVESSSLKPYVQDVPFESRIAWLKHIRSAIYEDFGALDVTNMSAGERTATEIEAAYEPMDENADDFENQCIEAIQKLLELIGIEASEETTPIFKRNRIANQYEQTQTVMLAADHLDEETLLSKLPWITVDEVPAILARAGEESAKRTEEE